MHTFATIKVHLSTLDCRAMLCWVGVGVWPESFFLSFSVPFCVPCVLFDITSFCLIHHIESRIPRGPNLQVPRKVAQLCH
jgi:hypothetical protein